jgi:hypothetical protein
MWRPDFGTEYVCFADMPDHGNGFWMCVFGVSETLGSTLRNVRRNVICLIQFASAVCQEEASGEGHISQLRATATSTLTASPRKSCLPPPRRDFARTAHTATQSHWYRTAIDRPDASHARPHDASRYGRVDVRRVKMTANTRTRDEVIRDEARQIARRYPPDN